MRAATRQTKRRRTLNNDNPRRATEEELEAAMKREFQIHAENATSTAWQPAWATDLQKQTAQQIKELQKQTAQQIKELQKQTAQQIKELQKQTAQQIKELQKQTAQQIKELQKQIGQQFDGLAEKVERKMDDVQRKQSNAATFLPDHPIQPLRNSDGDLPGDDFPITFLGLTSLTDAELGRWLEFYGLPQNPDAFRLIRLKFHLGMRP